MLLPFLSGLQVSELLTNSTYLSVKGANSSRKMASSFHTLWKISATLLYCTCTVPVWLRAQRLTCWLRPPPPLPLGPPPSSCMPCWSRTHRPRMQCAPGAWGRRQLPRGWSCKDLGKLWWIWWERTEWNEIRLILKYQYLWPLFLTTIFSGL